MSGETSARHRLHNQRARALKVDLSLKRALLAATADNEFLIKDSAGDVIQRARDLSIDQVDAETKSIVESESI